jgi:hypothetical protein
MMRALAGLFVVALLGGCAQSQVRLAEPDAQIQVKPERVLVMAPEINLYELQFGGQLEPRADWTLSARKLVSDALATRLGQTQSAIVNAKEPERPDPREREQQIRKLADAVMNSVYLYELGWAKGTLQNKRDRFDWTLGPGTQILRDRYGADYALVLGFEDSYTSAGRAAGMVLGALLGVSMQGGVQVGLAALVETKTGKVAWFNLIVDGTGDLRNAKDAQTAVDKLLEKVPL